MYFNYPKPSFNRSILLTVVGSLHLVFIWVMLHDTALRPLQRNIRTSHLLFLSLNDLTRPIRIAPFVRATNSSTATTDKKHEVAKPMSVTASKSTTMVSTKDHPPTTAQPEVSAKSENHLINRDVKALTQNLEREWAQEERKEQAAKPPNQLVREYWEKQNQPYRDKWDALANKIEKAGVVRGPQEESYTLDDGSRITKINGICYKAPDPGRSYLAQAEVRRVFCPRN